MSGRFFVGWELVGHKFAHLRVVLFPDADSTKLLPHAAESGPVQELLFPDAAHTPPQSCWTAKPRRKSSPGNYRMPEARQS